MDGEPRFMHHLFECLALLHALTSTITRVHVIFLKRLPHANMSAALLLHAVQQRQRVRRWLTSDATVVIHADTA